MGCVGVSQFQPCSAGEVCTCGGHHILRGSFPCQRAAPWDPGASFRGPQKVSPLIPSFPRQILPGNRCSGGHCRSKRYWNRMARARMRKWPVMRGRHKASFPLFLMICTENLQERWGGGGGGGIFDIVLRKHHLNQEKQENH